MREAQTYQFDCHEYTWSDQGIGGSPVGWGIKASSRTGDRDLLNRLEKLAASACVDSRGRVPVEELMYEGSLGFVKMVSEPARPGKDHRKNVRVRLYHCLDKECGPEVYLAPHSQWPHSLGKGLAPLEVKPLGFGREELLGRYQLQGRSLADFLDLVFSCIGQNKAGCFAVRGWEEDQYGIRGAELMLAVHLLLPRKARQYAGYLSFSRTGRDNVPFYFRPAGKTDEGLERAFFLPGSREGGEGRTAPAGAGRSFTSGEGDWDSPWRYMCFHLAELLDHHEDEAYDRFISLVDEKMTDDRMESSADFMAALPWIFYEYFCKEGGDRLPDEILIHAVPQLCYWKAGGLIDASLLQFVMGQVRGLRLSLVELRGYFKDLTGGMTSRTREDMLPEMTRVMDMIKALDPGAGQQELKELQKGHKEIYRALTDPAGEEQSSASVEDHPWIDRLGSLALERPGRPDLAASERKDQSQTGPAGRPLDEDRRGREDLGSGKEKSFEKTGVSEMDERKEEAGAGRTMAETGKEEQMTGRTDPEERPAMEKAGKGASLVAVTRSLSKEETDQEAEHYLTFLLGSLPQGFLTACMMFLSLYSIKIGHWKIALGMAGVWTILMANYQRELLEKNQTFPVWMVLGLNLVEGFVVSQAAWLLPSQKIRLFFFLFMGIMTLLSQLITIFRIVRKDR